MHQRAVLAGGCFWRMQDLDPQASRRCLDSRRLYWRRHSERDLPQPWYSCGRDRNRLRYSGDELPTHPGVFLPNPRSHDAEPSGQRYRHKLTFGDLLYERRAEKGGGADDRRRERVGPMAGQGRHRGDACRRLLGSRAGAPGLSGALSEWLHLSLPSSQLNPSQAGDRWRVHGNSCSYWRGCSVLENPESPPNEGVKLTREEGAGPEPLALSARAPGQPVHSWIGPFDLRTGVECSMKVLPMCPV